MKTNLEKPKKIPKKTTLEVSPKAVVDEMTKKIPRKNTNRVQAYGYQRPMGKPVSEKGPSKVKPRVSKKKIEEIIPEAPNLDMQPVDEKEDWDHTKKSEVRPYWKTPENIPIEGDFTEAFDDIGLQEIIAQPDEEGAFLIDEFGTKDPSEIDRITAERLASGDYEKVVGTEDLNSEYNPIDDFQEKQTQDFLKNKQVHGNPNSYELRKPKREKNSGHDYGNGARENQGFLAKIKNFWNELQQDTKSIAEELGWDEEKELEKQAKQYKESLKEHPVVDQDHYRDAA